MPQLDDAINAMAQNQPDLVLKDLQEATVDLEKMRDMAKALQQLQQQAEKLGKDLAEQLKNGQPELAQATLQKMVSELQSANLPPEQLQKILQEVSKAIPPAGNYGKVAEHLQKATGQMRSGDKPGAAQVAAGGGEGVGQPDAADGRCAVVDGDAGQPEPGFAVHRLGPGLGHADGQQAGLQS